MDNWPMVATEIFCRRMMPARRGGIDACAGDDEPIDSGLGGMLAHYLRRLYTMVHMLSWLVSPAGHHNLVGWHASGLPKLLFARR